MITSSLSRDASPAPDVPSDSPRPTRWPFQSLRRARPQQRHRHYHTESTLVDDTPLSDPSVDLEAAVATAPHRRHHGIWARDQHQDRPKLTLAQRSLRITWAWFPVNMSTGALTSLLGQQPYSFCGLTTIGKVFYLINLVTFVIFLVLIAARFIRKPRAFITSLHHPSESFFFGGFWVAVALLIDTTQTYAVPDTGPWLVKALRVLYWWYYAVAAIVAVFQYYAIFHLEMMTLSDALPNWVLPAYPFLVIGVVSSNIAKTQPPESAVQMIIAGICGQGLGWTLALFIYTVYLVRLINSPMPPAPTRPGMYISVGPAAYTCVGLLTLGKDARDILPAGFLGVEAIPVGDVWYTLSVPAALFLWLVAVWFSALTTLSVVQGAGKMRFALQWWAFVFPNAGLAMATIHIGDTLRSEGIKISGVIVTVVLVPLWILCAVMHLRGLWLNELLAPGKDVGVDDVNYTHDLKKQRHEERKMQRRELRRLRGLQTNSPPPSSENGRRRQG